MVCGEIGARRWSWGGGVLHTVRWGEEVVAFHEATASTHVFDEDTVLLLKTLRALDSAVTSEVLWRATFGEAPSAADCEAIDATLETLLNAGLALATGT